MVTRTLAIVNPLGMHARAAARFVRMAMTFESHVKVGKDGRVMDGKSIMGVLLLAAAQGALITISAEGPDETEALDALSRLVEAGFGETPCSA
jgi:phosphocarrier protein